MNKKNTNEIVTISAFSEDYSEKAYKLYYANNQFEFIPKSFCKFIEAQKTGKDFGEGVESRYFEIPYWIYKNLKGVEFYSVL